MEDAKGHTLQSRKRHVNRQDSAQANRTSTRRERLLTGSMIAVLGALIYVVALTNPLVYDDHRLILENTSLQHLTDWREIVFHDVARPVVNLSYAVDYAIWSGPLPFGFHLTNVVIHVINIALLFSLAIGLDEDARQVRVSPNIRLPIPADSKRAVPLAARVSAVLFAVHPILTQGVAYVGARAELLCAAFLMIAFLAARRAMHGRRWFWIAAVAGYVVALASKEIAVMFPFALLLYDRLFSPGGVTARRRRIWIVHMPLIAVTIAAGITRLWVLTTIEHPDTVVRWKFALVELDVFRRYLQLLVVPVGQTIFHSIDPIHGLFEPRALASLTIAALFSLAIWRVRNRGIVSLGLAWFAFLLVPSAALVVLDRGEPMAEQRLYTASMGLFLAAGVGADVVMQRLRQISSTSVARARWIGYAIVAILCVRTVSRTIVWHSPVSLWLEAAEFAPDHWLPRLALGEALHEQGRHQEAISMFQASLAFRPTEAVTYAKLGQCQIEMGRLPEAESTFQRLRALDPDSKDASTGLGLVALQARDSNVARRYFLETLARDPSSVQMRQVLAQLAEETDPGEALRLCEEIRRLAPDTPGNDECISRNRARLQAEDGRR